MAMLVVMGPPSPGVRHQLNGRTITVLGRDPSCDIVLNKTTISRHHAQILLVRGRYYIEDSGSTNGTLVNGKRIQGRTVLADGDRIVFFDVPLCFYTRNDIPVVEEATDRLSVTETRSSPETDSAMLVMVAEPDPGLLRHRIESLLEITRHLGSTLQPEEILPRVLDLLFKMFPQTVTGEIHLADAKGTLAPVAMKHGRESDSTNLSEPPLQSALTANVFESGVGQLHTEDAGADNFVFDYRNESTICVQILDPAQNKLGVVLLVTDDSSAPFREQDLELTSVVGVLAGQALGYARAHALRMEHEKTHRDLVTARAIQQGVLPQSRPQVPGYAFCEHYSTAEAVGGDFFAYEELPDNRVVVVIADATGKGLPAAMQVVRFAGELRLRLATAVTLKAALKDLNRFVCTIGNGFFFTCCVCVLDTRRNELNVASAGHMAPLCRRRTGEVISLTSPRGGLPLGIDPDDEIHPIRFPLDPGDRVLLYTDGASEAMNKRKELYGVKRLSKQFSDCRGDVNSCINALVDDITRFRQGSSPNDDMCLVSFERLS